MVNKVNKLAHGISIETIRGKFFICDKNLNRWLEISPEAVNCIKNNLSGKNLSKSEEFSFIEYLLVNGYLIDSSKKEMVISKQVEDMQIIIEVGDGSEEQKKSLLTITGYDNIALKYKPGMQIGYYIKEYDPVSIIIDDIHIIEFLSDCCNLNSSISIVINYKNKEIEKIIDYISELYIKGFESINIYYNINELNVANIDSFICLASEYMLGFNWNISWCLEKYSIEIVYQTLRNVLIAYEKYKFAPYPQSPLFQLNSFLPCFKCNFPQNKMYICSNGEIKRCEYILKNNKRLLPKCCSESELDENCTECLIQTFCPFKSPCVCNNNCLSIRFLQEYRLCVYSDKQSISQNVDSLNKFYECFCKESSLCGKV